jgi:4-diphosphocytidyl-2-C-methyl-D-erythritol kinase
VTVWSRARVNAKVNLWLAVRGRRPDGYHDIETVFHGIDLADEIELGDAPAGRVDVQMHFDGVHGSPPAPEDDLAGRAARSFLDAAGVDAGVRIEIRKRVPLRAGLGGGSADAAGVLELLRARFGEPVGIRVDQLAARLGSDVPYFLAGGSAVGVGRGDRVRRLRVAARLWFVLGLSDTGLATPDVYRRWDRMSSGPQRVPSDAVQKALRDGEPAAVAELLHNDLESAARDLRPELGPKKQRMLEAGVLGACVSGSGPTIFGIAASEAHARSVGNELRGVFARVVVAGSSRRSIEPLP